MIDLDQGWRTQRLDLEPLTLDHAAELAPMLDDAALHEFTGGAPLAAAALAAHYARLAVRRSPDSHQLWGNWVMRIRGTGMAAGTVQVTLPAGGPAGWVVAAHIHPAHPASQRVARAAGLSPTGEGRDGEILWVSPSAAAP